MTYRFLWTLILAFITTSCQVSENITPSLQSSGMSTQTSSPLQVIYPEDGWYKLNDVIKLEFLHSDRIQVIGSPYLKAQVGVKLGVQYNCLPASDCPASQSSGLSSIRFDPKNFFLEGSFTLFLPGDESLLVKFGALANSFDTICSRCSGTEMAEDLEAILENRVGNIYQVKRLQNSVALSTERRFYYASGKGTNKVTFQYAVSENDLDIDGIEFSPKVEPANSLFVYNFTEKPILAEYQLHFDQRLFRLDGDVPRVLSVTPPSAGYYDTGKSLTYKVQFSEDVTINNLSGFGMSLNSADKFTKYKTGSGTRVAIFSKTIQANDSNSQMLVTDNTFKKFKVVVDDKEYETTGITDKAGNELSSALPSSSSAVIVNATSPTIESVSLKSSPGTYKAGEKVQFEVEYSENVSVGTTSVSVGTTSGLPSLNLKLQTGIYDAKYVSGTGSTKLLFEYSVETNQASTGIDILFPIALNGGKITSSANGKDAVLISSQVASFGEVSVDSRTGPYVTSISPPAPGFYKENSVLAFTFEYSSPVTVSYPYPKIPLLIGIEKKYATYSDGFSTDGKVVFTYTTTNPDEDLDGIFISGPVENFTSIKDINPTPKSSIATFIPPDTQGVKIDGTIPKIKGLTTPATGILLGGMDLDFIVEFTEDVTHSGTPTLPFQLGCPACLDKVATLVAKLSGTKYLFRYKIEDSDSSSGVKVLSPTEIYKDQVDHYADLTLTAEQSNKTGFVIDAVVPKMASFVSPPNKTSYKAGDTLEFRIIWNNQVMVNGIPKIQFSLRDSKNVTAEALYVQNSAAPLSNESLFRYVVKNNDKASLGIELLKLDLNGGSIQDASGNSATTPVLNHDLAEVKIDGVKAMVVGQTTPPDKLYKIGDTLFFSVSWNEAIKVEGSPYILLQMGDKKVKALYDHTTDGSRASFQYQVKEGYQLLDLNGIEIFSEVYLNPLSSITDLAGNPVSLSLRPRDLTGVRIDGIRPDLLMLIGPEDGVYNQGQRIIFTVFWAEPVIINGTPRIGITIGSATEFKLEFASCITCSSSTPTTKSVFAWDVKSSYLDGGVRKFYFDDDGIELTAPLVMNLTNVTIQDTAGNFIAPPVDIPELKLPGVKVDGKIAAIESITTEPEASYKMGEIISVDVKFTEPVDVAGTPKLNLFIGSNPVPKSLNYTKLSNDKLTATFSYTIEATDNSFVGGTTTGIKVEGPITFMGGASIKDMELFKQDIDPTFREKSFPKVVVDGVAPKISNISVTNGTRAINPNAFIANETMRITLTFDDELKIPVHTTQGYTDNIKLELKIGNEIKEATYVGHTKTSLTMKYTIPSMTQTSALLDLDGIQITKLTLGLIPFEDLRGNSLNLTINGFTQKVYVYYSHFRGRFSLLHPDQNHYTTTPCGANKCLETLKDISGHNKLTFFPSTGDQIVVRDTGFGQKSKRHLKMTAPQSLFSKSVNNDDPSIRYVIIVYKGPSNASNTETVSKHNLIRRLKDTPIVNEKPNYHTSLQLTSKDIEKGIYFDIDPDTDYVQQRFSFNDKSLSQYVSSFVSLDLWDKGQPYVLMTEYRSGTKFNHTVYKTIPYGTMIGGAGFNGEIAEIIFMFHSESLKPELLNQIKEQLNDIYELY